MADSSTFEKGFAEIKKQAESLPQGWDLTDETQDPVIEEYADKLLALKPTYAEILKAEEALVAEQEKLSVLFLLAVKCCKSVIEVQELKEKCHITFAVPVYGEQNRVQRKKDHEAGENFVRRKVRQMNWLVGKSENLTYDLMFVDDGCKHGSGKIIEGIIKEEKYENVCSVVFLQKCCDDKQPEWMGIETTKDSIKGGACLYAMWCAKQKGAPEGRFHVIGFTDSDLSSHLGQTGSLVKECQEGAVLTVATRYESGGVYCSAFKPEAAFCLQSRSAGNLAFRHALRKQILPPLANVFDTQCGFKAFRSDKLDEVLPKIKDKKASFDMELILVSGNIGKVALAPVIWVESLAESNFWGSTDSVYESYFKISKRMVLLNDQHNAEMSKEHQEQCKPYVEFLRQLELEKFKALMGNLTKTLTEESKLFELKYSVDELNKFMDAPQEVTG